MRLTAGQHRALLDASTPAAGGVAGLMRDAALEYLADLEERPRRGAPWPRRHR